MRLYQTDPNLYSPPENDLSQACQSIGGAQPDRLQGYYTNSPSMIWLNDEDDEEGGPFRSELYEDWIKGDVPHYHTSNVPQAPTPYARALARGPTQPATPHDTPPYDDTCDI